MPNDLGQAQRFAVAAMAKGRKDFLDRPAALDSSSNGLSRNVQFSRPFHHRHCAPVQRQEMIIGSIVLLHSLRRPPAIAWLVATRIVNAVDRMSGGRLRPHVSKEALKIPPLRRHPNAFCPIFRILGNGGILAALADVNPGDMLGCARTAMGRVLLNVQAPVNLNIEAAARAGRTGLKDVGAHGSLPTALAATEPARIARTKIFGTALNKPPSEALTAKVLKLRHLSMYHIQCGMASHG